MQSNYKIYVHINKVNGKMYIGQTKVRVERRWNNGNGYKPCTYFYRAIEKYGWDGFEHIILLDNLSLDVANIIESELINKYNTTNIKYGYNIRNGGNNSNLSEETKRKISVARMGKYTGEENPFYGKHLSDESKKMISKANKGRLVGDKNPMYHVYLTKENNHNYKKTMTQEQKDKISKTKKEKHMHLSDEHKEKLRISFSGKNNPNYGKHINVGETHPRCKAVEQYDLNDNYIASFWGAKEVENIFGFNHSAITACCKERQKTAFGFKWKYKK